jgi:hypothetical protein
VKILERVNIYRVEYHCPHPPGIGDYTFHCAAHSIEEVISELCIVQNINPSLVRERAVISKLDCISSTLLDKLITQNLESYLKRSESHRKKYEEYMKQYPTKPSNLSRVTDNNTIFSVL